MISAPALESLLVLLVALLAGGLGSLVALRQPWWAVVATVASLPLVPFWIGQSVSGFFVSLHLALALVSLFAVLRVRRTPMPISLVDWALLVIAGLTLLAFVTRQLSIAHVYALLQWLVLYAFARVSTATYGVRRVITVFCLAAAVTAAAMLVEAATGMNPWVRFVRMNNSLYHLWSNLQSRGGVLRAEGAFGHSIAAGASLAVAAVLSLSARIRESRRLLLLALLIVATLTTISRIGMVTIALGVGLAVVVGSIHLSQRVRGLVLGLLALGGLGYVQGLGSVFAESGAEAANSAAYRTWLLELIPSANLIGMADSFARSTAGGTSFGAYRSIDSALLLFALTHGWIATALALVLLAAAVLRVLRLQAGTATIAVAAQIPALATVALITQYSLVFWLVAGIAVSESLGDRSDAATPRTVRRRTTQTSHPLSEEPVPC